MCVTYPDEEEIAIANEAYGNEKKWAFDRVFTPDKGQAQACAGRGLPVSIPKKVSQPQENVRIDFLQIRWLEVGRSIPLRLHAPASDLSPNIIGNIYFRNVITDQSLHCCPRHRDPASSLLRAP